MKNLEAHFKEIKKQYPKTMSKDQLYRVAHISKATALYLLQSGAIPCKDTGKKTRRYIEAVYPYDDPVALICGEEAKLEGKPLNRALRDGDGDIYDIVAGKFFICGLGDENFASLPKELQQKYEEKFRQPEAFLKMGSKIMAIPTEPAKAAGKGKTAPVTER